MPDCNNLLHPFQTDPGTSQRQRVADALLSGAPLIDGRKLADLLDYFVQVSRHVRYYDNALQMSDWQPFFQNSTPFVLATIIKYNHESVTGKFELYNKIFDKNPSAQGLRLLLHYVFYNAINRINDWHLHLEETDLPVTAVTEKLVKDKLADPVKQFIKFANTAAKWFPVNKIDFQSLQKNEVWNLTTQDLEAVDANFISTGTTPRKRLIALRKNVRDLLPSFVNVIKTVAGTAELNIEQSLFPLKQELQKQHTPHLGLLFAFLKLFQHLQSDLNGFTRKHLDFFYTEVLKMKPRGADPDKVHIIFEIQNQLDKYLLKKGLQVKDSKDNNKAEVFFALDDEIVVNKAEVSDVRTLFINNQSVYRKDFIQGVYMAPDSRKADGVKIDFSGSGLNSWPTVGARLSKYTDPVFKAVKPYPAARLGFILASPVLFLQEGKRTVEVNLACKIEDMCSLLGIRPPSRTKDCCGDKKPAVNPNEACQEEGNEPVGMTQLFDLVNTALKKTFIHITEELIQEAIKKGLTEDTAEKIRRRFMINDCNKAVCCSHERSYVSETVVREKFWNRFLTLSLTPAEKTFLQTIFKPQRVFSLYFSGAEKWIEPDRIKEMRMVKSATDATRFSLGIKMIINPDKPAITFYDKEKLKEDFETEQPVLKVELNPAVRLVVNKRFRKRIRPPKQEECCLDKTKDFCAEYLSLYHFFRNVRLSESATEKTTIVVKVCGLKNFVVQNDDGLMNVNSPIFPFGTRPEIVDFNVVNKPTPKPGDPPPPPPNLIGPNFYVGSKEVFCKKWDVARINLNWKDKPSNFREYYKAYVLEDQALQIFGLDDQKFMVRVSDLHNGGWREEAANRKLFDVTPLPPLPDGICDHGTLFAQGIILNPGTFLPAITDKEFTIDKEPFERFDNRTRNGFVRINMREQDFLHKDYAYVLSRQMMALGRLPDVALEGAVYIDHSTNNVINFKGGRLMINALAPVIIALQGQSHTVSGEVNDIIQRLSDALNIFGDAGATITNAELNQIIAAINNIDTTNSHELMALGMDGLRGQIDALNAFFSFFDLDGNVLKPLEVPIPNEPWTPVIANMSIDYVATAGISDIDFIHLYPYTGTFKHEEIELEPALLPTFCDEGNLYIGLKKLVPGSNVHMLFQLAEATADSESEREAISWYYLHNNFWIPLREGFEVLNDDTNGLTTSGIVKIATPAQFSVENTILPKGLHWIKAAIHKNSRSVSETVGIHTQAVRATFTNESANDKMRLANPLPAQSVAKLKEADTAVKKVNQPYDSFDGRIPEIEGQYYVRVSELLRHKGRAIQKFDYERLVLEAFPQLLKAKCINHSYALNAHQYKNDFPIAPGYVLLAVLPDLNKLKAPQSLEPRVPVSLLEKIEEYLVKRTSPFVRLRAMNARYEKVNFCLTVKLYPGKDENYYKEKLQQDIREFLAPWAIGQYDQLTFGQPINRSDIIRFLETRDYLDYLLELKMQHEDDGAPSPSLIEVNPKTPRSILIAGHVEVCIRQGDCEKWDEQFRCANEPDKIMDYCKNNRPNIN